MDQAELRALESRCIQEEAPKCVAACPLHVDVRAFCKLMGEQKWDKAWQVLAKTLPLPGILARMCDGPCMDVCVRNDAGGAIAMNKLEKFCAEKGRPVSPPRPLPSKGKTVAVLGGGLSGLCAAWETARRGFKVTVYCEAIGAALKEQLGEKIVAREIEGLMKLGVLFEEGSELSTARVDALLTEHDAVYVDSDSVPKTILDFGTPDELTLGTVHPGLFASPAGRTSAVLTAAFGRRAANSIERYTQGVSLVSNRDKEGPYATRLYTSLANIESEPCACAGECTEETAGAEAQRCLQCECMECVKTCEYLREFKAYPKIYARQIYNNESIVMGTRQANRMINSCMLCGLCETICPEDFSMADVCLSARQTLVEQNHMPPSAHEFALRDMAFANGEACHFVRHAPGMEKSEYVFFPGCQLTASDPDGVDAAYTDLRSRLGDVGLMLKCCGAPAEWAGRTALFDESIAEIRAAWEDLGRPRIIASCPTCIKMLRKGLAEAEIVSHWSILRALGLPGGALKANCTLAVNDPCSSRHDRMMQEDVRALLEEMDVVVTEPELTGETTECCGYGGLLSDANPALARKVADKRAGAMDDDWVTYCVMCRDQFAKSGKRALHLYDLLFPRGGQRESRQAPGYSERRENRVHLKDQLLREMWHESGGYSAEPHEMIEVAFTENAHSLMETRRILKSDVQKVLLQARESGNNLVNIESGRLVASLRPAVVTYWVDYEPQEDGYLVHNVWSHRMKIKGGQP